MNLVSRFRVDEADSHELSQVLLGHFSNSREIEERVLRFGQDDTPGLTVKYDRKGRVSGIRADKELPERDIETIETAIVANLLTPGPSLVARGVLFANVATDSWYRYHDFFQISEVPAYAPRPEYLVGLHPFQIEVRFTSSNSISTSFARRTKALREVELLCAALLAVNIRSVGNNAAISHWILENPGESKPRSVFRQEMYTWEGFKPVDVEFSTIEAVPRMATCDPQSYYARHGYSVESRLDIPSTIDLVLNRYFALDDVSQKQFCRAAYWYQFAKETWARSHSAAFIAFVSAIEALKDRDREKVSICTSCGQRAGEGPTAKFAALLDQLAPVTNVPVENRKVYYWLRSALAHGDKLLQDDISIWHMNMASMGERRELRALAQIVQAALYNWLLHRAPARAESAR